MSRPFHYKKLDTLQEGDKEHQVLGHPVFYAIRCRGCLVTLGQTNHLMKKVYTKYRPIYGATRKTIQNHCDRLNDIFKTQDYEVVTIRAEDLG